MSDLKTISTKLDSLYFLLEALENIGASEFQNFPENRLGNARRSLICEGFKELEVTSSVLEKLMESEKEEQAKKATIEETRNKEDE